MRRYVTCGGGRDLLVQLPSCYTPSGLLSDFDDGGRIDMMPVDEHGKKQVEAFRELCERLVLSTADEKAAATALSTFVPVSVEGAVTACASRVRDVRIFEAADLPADNCAILAGDTVTAIVSPEYVWTGKQRRGINVRLVQLFLHTDRGRYRSFMCSGARMPLPQGNPPPPMPVPMPQLQKRREQKQEGYMPTLLDIVTAKNALRRTTYQP
jgi:hypothetical protein